MLCLTIARTEYHNDTGEHIEQLARQTIYYTEWGDIQAVCVCRQSVRFLCRYRMKLTLRENTVTKVQGRASQRLTAESNQIQSKNRT